MSRHVLIDRPELQVVVGFDAQLRYFFGQAFNPSRPDGEHTPFAGWPTRYGLGIQRPIASERQAEFLLASLGLWLRKYLTDAEQLVAIRARLLAEWQAEA